MSGDDMYLSPAIQPWAVLIATAEAYLKRVSAYAIELVRWPLGPLITYATWRVTYGVSGRSQVDGAAAAGFLLVGIFGWITWTSSIWASGYAIEFERGWGTSAALFLSPASRAAVVAGYGLGSFLWFLPSFLSIVVLGMLTGARLHVTDPLALLAAVLTLFIASLAVGFTLAGLFILSRRGNLMANFLQWPIFLLAGMVVPLSSLPAALRQIAEALPATHAVTALRQAALLGYSLSGTGHEVTLALGISVLFWLIGLVGLRRVESVAKRKGHLDLY